MNEAVIRLYVKDEGFVDIPLPRTGNGNVVLIPHKGDEIKYLGAAYKVDRVVWNFDLDETSIVVFAK